MKKINRRFIVSVIAAFTLFGIGRQIALAQDDVPKVEVGALYTLLSDFESTLSGFGGRITFNPHHIAGLEAEVSHYPDAFFRGSLTTGLVGLKLTARGQHAAAFAKIRPGFAHARSELAGIPRIPGVPQQRSDTEFAIDFGGGSSCSQRDGSAYALTWVTCTSEMSRQMSLVRN